MLKNLWDWFNGNKIAIGTALLGIEEVWQRLIVEIWKFQPSWNESFEQTLLYLGGVLTGTGLVHRVVKMFNKEGQ